DLGKEDLAALDKGIANLQRHVNNVRDHYGLPCVVAVNHFTADTDAEHALLASRLAALNVPLVVARHWAAGGAGATDLARKVVELAETGGSGLRFVYDEKQPLWDKVKTIAVKIYGAADISAEPKIRARIDQLQADYGHYPVCIAKTQYSFSTDAGARGAPSGHIVNIREVRLAAGAEFIVFVCGDVMTMPGLPKSPSADKIDIDAQGRVVGLF
ncbi:MAG TPA: formate--tetrahydrofolate ligase, partial [Steroidobacteraceae bacterium]|nr:formate--tetrahydrofolate ligase [Steroidobacteraceae bacterium]